MQVQGRLQWSGRIASGLRRPHSDLNSARTNVLEATKNTAVIVSELKPYLCTVLHTLNKAIHQEGTELTEKPSCDGYYWVSKG